MLNDTTYTCVDDLKRAACALYSEYKFDGNDTILTHLDDHGTEVPLTSVPTVSEDLFLQFIHPACAMCSSSFGVVDKHRLYQCPRARCAEQYCHSCVQAIQGSLAEHTFACISCREKVVPQRHLLLEKHLIWPNMCQLYGTQSLLDLQVNSRLTSADSIAKNIDFRLIHLGIRLKNFELRMRKCLPATSADLQLVDDVKNLCSNLESLLKHLDEISEEMSTRGVIVRLCLQTYRENLLQFDAICEALMNNIEQKSTMSNLDHLSDEQNLKAVDEFLKDISFRKDCLIPRIVMITKQSSPNATVCLNLIQAEEMLGKLSALESHLIDLRANFLAIEQSIVAYDKLLRDENHEEIPCSKFILLLEKLRVRSEELELVEYFPEVSKLMTEWQADYGRNEDFRPKAIALFLTLEADLNYLLNDRWSINVLPYRIGVIGSGSVGKTALIAHLCKNEEFLGMVDIERSTFGYLPIDTFIYKNPLNGQILPITFVDIEGAIDVADANFTGSYREIIDKADCDLYLIAFDGLFSERNRAWQEYIEKEQSRKCLLVRTKTDLVFKKFYQPSSNRRASRSTINSNYQLEMALQQTKDHARATFDDKRLSADLVYLTAIGCDDNELKQLPIITFDLQKLEEKLIRLASEDPRIERLRKLTNMLSKTIINTCFRRCYLLSKTFYKALAAGASIIPFLDELVTFAGRQRLRETIGIQESFAGELSGTIDMLEEYLRKKNFQIPKGVLSSGYFQYLVSEQISHARPARTKNTARASDEFKRLSATGGVMINVVNELFRVNNPSATAASRGISIASIVAGIALPPVSAVWSYRSTGIRINEHLHQLCDDLVIVAAYFVDRLCEIQCPIQQTSTSMTSEEH